MESYNHLKSVFTRLHWIEHFSALGEWDMAVNITPKAAEARGLALTELVLIRRNTITDSRLKKWLDDVSALDAADTSIFSAVDKANIREMHRIWYRENKLPENLVSRTAVVSARAGAALSVARTANDWSLFLPYLEEVVEVSRERGRVLSEGTNLSPYEALMDEYEPGFSVEEVKDAFDNIKKWLPSLLQAVVEKQKKEQPIIEVVGPFPVEAQRKLNLEIMKTWEFDFDAGRLDVSMLPFCGGVPEDVRITTRYTTDNYDASLMGVIHECGHAKYEQNRPRQFLTQPVSNTRSMGIHESQSLFSEMQLGRSAPFARFLLRLIREAFGDQAAFNYDNFVRSMQVVKPGLSRLDADELCYPLHIILRFEIEYRLIDGTIKAADVPAMWDELMHDYFGLDTRGNYSEGPLQDIHWAMGSFGYFPTYTLGALYAAQFMWALKKDLGEQNVDDLLAAGNLEPILDWQKRNIWEPGSIYTTKELLLRATGKRTIDPLHYRQHLTKRYLGLNVDISE